MRALIKNKRTYLFLSPSKSKETNNVKSLNYVKLYVIKGEWLAVRKLSRAHSLRSLRRRGPFTHLALLDGGLSRPEGSALGVNPGSLPTVAKAKIIPTHKGIGLILTLAGAVVSSYLPSVERGYVIFASLIYFNEPWVQFLLIFQMKK